MRFFDTKFVFFSVGLIFLVLLSFFYWDIPVSYYCMNLSRPVRNFFGSITLLGISTWYIVGSLVLFLLFRGFPARRLYAQQALLVLLSIAASGILVIILKVLFGRYRPEMMMTKGLYGIAFLEFQSDLLSFPSGHAATVFALAGALSCFHVKYRFFLFPFAILVAMSRVIITSHYLSDVIMGAYIGLATVYFIRKTRLNSWANLGP